MIFFARICDVSLQTLRTILVVRGERLKGACLGFFEVIIYVVAFNAILGSLDNLGNLLAYALGFASGNYIGGMVEEKLAFGIQSAQIITMKEPLNLACRLRELGYGVTIIEGSGRTGTQFLLQTLVERKHMHELSKVVDEWDRDNFMIVTDARSYQGGTVSKQKQTKAALNKKGK
ncbi:MAG: DUF2179 domain-containing protein [Peptococcaceae bacterium]|nr:DUF2179 domain-containing protein [Peptococcaceae bacterium]